MPGCGPEEEAAVGVSEEVVVDSSRFFLEEDGLDTPPVETENEQVITADDEDDGGIHVGMQHHHHLDQHQQVGQVQHLHTRHRGGRSHSGRHSNHARGYHEDAEVDGEEVCNRSLHLRNNIVTYGQVLISKNAESECCSYNSLPNEIA